MPNLKAYRAKSGNSYLVESIDNDVATIFFPFLNIHGLRGTLPISRIKQDEYLGEVAINDNTLDFSSLMAITHGN